MSVRFAWETHARGDRGTLVMGPVLMLISFWALPAGGIWALRGTWRDQMSTFERGGMFTQWLGESARNGYDAGFPVMLTVAGSGLAALSVPAALESFGHPNVINTSPGQLVLHVAITLMLIGLALGWSLTLFMFPKMLAPPHLRYERGWIPACMNRMRLKRAQRRTSRRHSR